MRTGLRALSVLPSLGVRKTSLGPLWTGARTRVGLGRLALGVLRSGRFAVRTSVALGVLSSRFAVRTSLGALRVLRTGPALGVLRSSCLAVRTSLGVLSLLLRTGVLSLLLSSRLALRTSLGALSLLRNGFALGTSLRALGLPQRTSLSSYPAVRTSLGALGLPQRTSLSSYPAVRTSLGALGLP
jgi:hypothetical protein